MLITLGANVPDIDFNPFNGFEGGVYNETNPSRIPDQTTRFYLDQTTFNSTYSHAVGGIFNTTFYSLATKNCVDYVKDILDYAGVSYNLADLFQSNVLDSYATTVNFLVHAAEYLIDLLT